MSKTTFFAALLSLSLSALCHPPKAQAAGLMIAGSGDAQMVDGIVFLTRAGSRQRALRHHHHYFSRARDSALNYSEISNSSALLSVARRYVGLGKFTRAPGPWCRDFINVVARRAGYRLANNSRRAIDALRLGRHVSTPRPGDLIVMRHHVTIFAGWGGRGVFGLGGNQSHRVRLSSYPERRVVAFVRL